MKVPFLLSVYTLLCTLAVTRATDPDTPIPSIEKGHDDRPDDPYPRTVDVGTYVIHYCHYDCVARYKYEPMSDQCDSCIVTCLEKRKAKYQHIAGYDASVESARKKNQVCLLCGRLHDDHLYVTTWMMCNFPERLENKFPASQEGVTRCRDRLFHNFKAPLDNAASYATHLCHYLCLFNLKKKHKPGTSDCVKCIQECSSLEMERLQAASLESVDDDDSNKKCNTCEKFDDRHIKETIEGICHYPHMNPRMGDTPEECTDTIQKRYNRRKG